MLLADDGTIRIADFGCARFFTRGPTATNTGERLDDAPPEVSGDGFACDTAGTYYFLSPEACSGDSYSAYDADVRDHAQPAFLPPSLSAQYSSLCGSDRSGRCASRCSASCMDFCRLTLKVSAP